VRAVVRDLAREPIPHLTAERFQAFLAEPHARSAEHQAIVAASDALIGELQAADVIVIGLTMDNFGVPSQLKAYFDHVARAGSTFRYTEGGPVGQEGVCLRHAGRPLRRHGTPRDGESAYVRQFLAFLGITDVEFVYAEGRAISDASRQAALAKVAGAIARLTREERLAA
jgi:FMN-dependent NADH-azoreductase